MKASHLTDIKLLRWELISTLTGGLSIAIGLRNEKEPDNYDYPSCPQHSEYSNQNISPKAKLKDLS